MRATLTAWCLGLVLALMAIGGAQAQIWVEVRPDGGRYTIQMPGPASMSTQQVPLPDGRSVTMFQALFETGDVAYLSSHVDYPPEIVRNTSPDTLLTNVMDGSAEGHTLRNQRRITIGGYQAREYVITQANGVVLVTRSVLVDNRLYQIIVARMGTGEDHPDTRKFLESFALMPR